MNRRGTDDDRDDPPGGTADVGEVIDRLYSLQPSEFTAARNAAAKELRKAGLRAEAAQVVEQQKPTAAAAAVNQLVRSRKDDVEQFLRAATALREAQVGDGSDLQGATKRERDALTRLVRAGGPQVGQSLQAAAVDHDAAEQLLKARLVRELEPAGFGTLLQHAKPSSRPGRAPAQPAKTRPKRDDGPARARLAEAKRAYREAQAEERRAERNLNRSQEKLAAAKAAVEKAQSALDRLDAA